MGNSRFHPYHLIKRKNKKGKLIYYARFVDTETGHTLKEITTRQSNQSAAVRWAEAKLPEITAEQEAASGDSTTVEEYGRRYFADGGPYERRRTARGYHVAKVYLATCRSYTDNHIIPIWGAYQLRELTVDIIDREILNLFQSGRIASATVNRTLRTFRLLLDGALQEGIINSNPAARVKQVKQTSRERGTFNRREIALLFSSPDLWPDYRHYVLNLLAFTSGMRLGEIRGLTRDNVFPDHIKVRYQWEDKVGLKAPKAGSIRDVAIPEFTAAALNRLIQDFTPETIVFYSLDDQTKPMTKSHIEKAFYRTLERAGIGPEERRARNLVFHSWRHTLNTILRSEGISDAKIQKITGHRSDAMTANYTHFRADDFREVSSLTGRLLEATG